MGKIFESEEFTATSRDLSLQLDYALERRMGKFTGTYEDFKVTVRLKMTLRRFGLTLTNNKKVLDSLMEQFYKNGGGTAVDNT